MERGVPKEEVVIVRACQRASAMFLPLNPKFILISFTARPLVTFDGSSQKQTTICPLLLDLHVSNSSSCLPVSSRCVAASSGILRLSLPRGVAASESFRATGGSSLTSVSLPPYISI